MKRKPGVLKDKKRGTWYYVIDAKAVDGKRRQIIKRGFPTADAAGEARGKKHTEIEAGNVPVPDNDSVAAFAKSWITALPAEGIEPATQKHYNEAVARLLPTIGAIKLQELTGHDLDRAYTDLRDKGRAARTIRASHVAVRKMLQEAIRLKKVTANVASDARPPRAKAAKAKRFETWKSEQLATFLDAVAEHEHAAFWTFAGWTGMRLGELVALKWEDVDLDKSEITVCRSVGRGIDGTYDKDPKSEAGERKVELDEPLVALLRGHRKAQTERRLAIGEGWRDHGLVFCEVDGAQVDPARASKRWGDLVRRHAPGLGLKVIRFHDLRHSHCTQLLDAGVRPDIVTERLGHASVAFTLQQYAHRYAGDQRSGLERLRSAQ